VCLLVRRENSDPGMNKQACVTYVDLMRDGIYRQGMSAVVGAYLVKHPVCVRAVLLNDGQLSSLSSGVDSVKYRIEGDDIWAPADL